MTLLATVPGGTAVPAAMAVALVPLLPAVQTGAVGTLAAASAITRTPCLRSEFDELTRDRFWASRPGLSADTEKCPVTVM